MDEERGLSCVGAVSSDDELAVDIFHEGERSWSLKGWQISLPYCILLPLSRFFAAAAGINPLA